MGETAGGAGRLDYEEPRVTDYGTLAQLTGDGAPMLLHHLGVTGGAAVMATAPAAPGDGGGLGSTETPRSAGGEGGAVGGEVVAPADGGGAGEDGAPGAVGGETGGETGVAGATAEGGDGVAGADELPFTGLDAAATAAAGAASLAAGMALRKAVDDKAAGSS